MKTLHNNAPYKRGGGYNLSLNAPSQSTKHNTTKKLVLSISLIAAAALELAANSSCDTTQRLWQQVNGTTYCTDLTPYSNAVWVTLDNADKEIDTLLPTDRPLSLDYRLKDDNRVGNVTHDTNGNKSQGWLEQKAGWTHLMDSNNMKGNNATITSFTIKGDTTQFEIKNTGNTTITTFNHNAKELKLNAQKLTITTLNQTSGNTTQEGGTIGTLNLKGGVFNHNGGTLTTINLQDGNGVFNNNAQNTNFTITQSGGDHTIGGKITTFTQNAGSSTIAKGGSITTLTLKSGSLTNNGEITTLTTADTQARHVRSAAPAAATAASSTITNGAQGTISNLTIDNTTLTNNGKIDKLTLNGTGSNKITNNPTYDGDGKAVNGTIKELVVSGGSSTINTLNGVAYDDTTGRSSITLQNGGNLKVETLDVGLRGNNAIARVQLNGNGTSGGTGSGKLSAEWVQVSYVDGSFNPTAGLANKDLSSYVTCNGSSTGGDCSTRTESSTKFRSSEGLREIGVLINEDGTSSFSVKDSLSADMTGLLIRQSMRRKMLLDTYLAEQSRTKLKKQGA